MTWNRLRSLQVVSCVAAFVTIGCGQGSPLSTSGSPGSIVGPTSLTADAAIDVATSSSLSDTFVPLGKGKGGRNGGPGGGEDEDDDALADGDDEAGRPNRGRGSLSGFVTEVTPTSITVRNVMVTVNADTAIRHGYRTLMMADIQVGDKVQVKGMATITETETTFTATEIKVEDMDHEGDDAADDDDVDDVDDADADAKIEGTISGLTGTCPALTFNVVSGTTTTTTTNVTTNDLTKFDDVLCTGLANDQIVEVKGTTQTDGSILATKVELED